MTRRRPFSALLMLCLVLDACGLLPTVEAPRACGFPPGTAISWTGHATTSQAGLSDADIGTGGSGMIYVTRDPVAIDTTLLPDDVEFRPRRQYCFIEDGGGTVAIGDLPEGWSPPTGS